MRSGGHLRDDGSFMHSCPQALVPLSGRTVNQLRLTHELDGEAHELYVREGCQMPKSECCVVLFICSSEVHAEKMNRNGTHYCTFEGKNV